MANSWSYNGPSESDKDKVRFYIGDTNEDDPLLFDNEIEFLLEQTGNVLLAASEACEAISSKFSRSADKQVGDLRLSASQKANAYSKRASELRKRAAMSVGNPVASLSDQSIFSVGMNDNRG